MHNDPVGLAKLDQFELRVVWVQLDLVYGRDDLGRWENLVELEFGAVGDADRADFALGDEFFELSPGLSNRPFLVDVAGAVFQGRE